MSSAKRAKKTRGFSCGISLSNRRRMWYTAFCISRLYTNTSVWRGGDAVLLNRAGTLYQAGAAGTGQFGGAGHQRPAALFLYGFSWLIWGPFLGRAFAALPPGGRPGVFVPAGLPQPPKAQPAKSCAQRRAGGHVPHKVHPGQHPGRGQQKGDDGEDKPQGRAYPPARRRDHRRA